jgi:hypothetical protein
MILRSSKKAFSKIYAIITAVIILVALVGTYYYLSNQNSPVITAKVNTITVNGIELEILNATKQNTYKMGGYTYDSNYGYFLIVKAHLLSGDVEQPSKWNVTVTDQEGHITPFALASLTNSTLTQGGFDYTETWVFDTWYTANSYNLNLPQGQNINLNDLII